MTESTASAAELLATQPSDQPRDVQYGHIDGVIDLTWGHPDPSAYATEAVGAATDDVLRTHGWQALSYGAPAGAVSVRSAIAEHLGRVDAAISDEAVVITSGSSGALDLVLSLLATPGDVVFVEQPTYFLALRIFADHGVTVVGLTSDDDGPDVDQFALAASELARQGRPALLYLVPTYANPTGRCLPQARQVALLEAAARHRVIVIEDDVYRDTTLSSPPSMFSIDPEQVIRLGSFSKSLSPGLRVGYITASHTMAERITGCGLLDSGGGVNHFAAMIVGSVISSGAFAEIVRIGQGRYAERRAALVAGLDRSVLTYETPGGGFFVWMRLPDGLDSTAVVAAAHDRGVQVTDGRLFFVGEPDATYVRASFSMLDIDQLSAGATLFSEVVRDLVR